MTVSLAVSLVVSLLFPHAWSFPFVFILSFMFSLHFNFVDLSLMKYSGYSINSFFYSIKWKGNERGSQVIMWSKRRHSQETRNEKSNHWSKRSSQEQTQQKTRKENPSSICSLSAWVSLSGHNPRFVIENNVTLSCKTARRRDTVNDNRTMTSSKRFDSRDKRENKYLRIERSFDSLTGDTKST